MEVLCAEVNASEHVGSRAIQGYLIDDLPCGPAISIEHAIRRLPDIHAAVAKQQAGGEIQTIGEHGDLVRAAVVVGVLAPVELPVGVEAVATYGRTAGTAR